MYTENKNGEIILQIDEIANQIVTSSEGTFIYVDKEVLEEWLVEVSEKLERNCCEY